MKALLVLVAVAAAAFALAGVAAARPAPVTWCGSDEVSADRVPELGQTSDDQVRVLYATPSDGPDNFSADASGIATDAAWIDQWWHAQDSTRTPRFDRYPFPGCTTTFGGLDIGFVRLPNPGSFYAGAGDDESVRLDDDLASVVAPNEKTVVYYDGAPFRGDICGETDYEATTQAGRLGLAYVFLQSDCSLLPVGNGPSAEVAAHELIHNLGAVPHGAPHECPDNPGHVCDTDKDVLYPYLDAGSTLDQVGLDVGRDDYYGHSGSQWDVQDSDWLSRLPQFSLSLAIAGAGSLQVSVGTHQLACEHGCTGVTLDNGAQVTVQAVVPAGWQISGWSGGGCGGKLSSCTVTMSQAVNATVTLARTAELVSVQVAGKGRVTSAPAGIGCPGRCSHTFAAGAVRLTAKPAHGWRFTGWNGSCSGRGSCVVSAARNVVRARFARVA